MTVSLEELSLRDGLVVCPQCLNAYQAVEAGTLPAVHGTKVDDPAAHPPKRYCPHCGQDIGHGINFCPYCGGSLHTDEDSATGMETHQVTNQPAAQPNPPHTTERHSGKTSHHRQENRPKTTQAFDWKPMIPSYRLDRQRQHEPASLGFQAFAFAVIIALLTLLAFIIYHGMSLT